LQALGYNAGSTNFFKRGFWMLMQVSAQSDKTRYLFINDGF
jgi:hypothetical protein